MRLKNVTFLCCRSFNTKSILKDVCQNEKKVFIFELIDMIYIKKQTQPFKPEMSSVIPKPVVSINVHS